MASNIHPLSDLSELVELLKPQSLYLKPISRLNVSVSLPHLKEPGKSISNWDLMEKIKKMVRPHQFVSIKVVKSTIEFVRFEAEVENRETLDSVIKLLDNSSIKIIGFFEALKVRAGEAKLAFPTKHDWDSFFRDAKNMNEMKAGERPDTIYLANVPCRWFGDLRQKADPKDVGKPSEFVLKRVFESFGDVRCVDIPMIDPYRHLMNNKSVGQSFGSFTGQELTFDAYVQFIEYIGFVKAMDALRGMKLVHTDSEGKGMAAPIKVDFDRSKHLSDKSICRRRIEHERLKHLERQKEEQEAREREERQRQAEMERNKELEAKRKEEEEKQTRRRIREEKRRLKQLELKKKQDDSTLEQKIKLEERKLLLAQRKLESVRLLSELIKRVQVIKQREEVENQLRDLEDAKRRQLEEQQQFQEDEEQRRKRLLLHREESLRKKVMQSWVSREEKRRELRRQERLRQLPENKPLSSVAMGVLCSSEIVDVPPKLSAHNRSPSPDFDDDPIKSSKESSIISAAAKRKAEGLVIEANFSNAKRTISAANHFPLTVTVQSSCIEDHSDSSDSDSITKRRPVIRER